jgi:CDP-diacylglycerol--serine O-phosphatidyltransferase
MKLKSAGIMVPSLFTTANMALGVFAIFVAHVMDILDGRIARWMNLTSSFGAEFDSFADWISFGIAPAFMVYILALKEQGKLGFLIAFLFIFAGAFRLARFNLKNHSPDDGSLLNFTGLPIPGAGGFIALLVLLFGFWENGIQGKTLPFLFHQIPLLKAGIPGIMCVLSFLMVSKVQYTTFKKTRIFQPKSLPTFMLTLFVVSMIYVYPQNTIFILYTCYILWGLIRTGWRAYRIRRKPASV